VASILKACDIYPDKENAVRLPAFVLRLRYSGLRIRDAITLSRNRMQGDKLFLYTAKTGTAVIAPSPLRSRGSRRDPASAYFFWTGLSKPKSAVGDWQRSLKLLVVLAGIPDGGIASGTHFQLSFCLRVFRLNACQFSWVIKVCESLRSIRRRGRVHARCN
jgi:hypothetical protein